MRAFSDDLRLNEITQGRPGLRLDTGNKGEVDTRAELMRCRAIEAKSQGLGQVIACRSLLR